MDVNIDVMNRHQHQSRGKTHVPRGSLKDDSVLKIMHMKLYSYDWFKNKQLDKSEKIKKINKSRTDQS